jgi:hypothetical protein
MKKPFAILIVLAICVVGFGFYRGWFALSSPSATAGSHEVNVNLATDTDKMKEDAQTVKDKAAELTANVTQGSAAPANPPTDEVQPNQLPPDDGQPPAVEPNPDQPNGN